MADREMPVSPMVLIAGAGEKVRQTAAIISLNQPVVWVGPGETGVAIPNVSVIPAARITRVQGQWGEFKVTVAAADGSRIITAGAIVLAWEQAPARLTGDCPLPAGDRVRPLSRFLAGPMPDGLQSISFLVGPGETDWPWTFVPALRSALALAERGTEVHFFFREYRVAASGLEELCHQARLAGVNMCRYQEPPAGRITEAGVEMVYRDPFLPSDAPLMKATADQLVAAEEYAPDPDTQDLIGILDISGLPPANVHYRPVKTSRPGIYLLGNPVYPEDEELEASLIATETAKLSRGSLVVEPGCAVVDPASCALCLTCWRICPHRAVELKGEPHNQLYGAAAWVHPLACQRCGLCVAECPSAAISFSQPEAEPAELSFGPPPADESVCLQVLACANSSWLTASRDLAGPIAQIAGRDRILIRRIPCAGQATEREILQDLLERADGVLVLPCFEQNCRHRRGNRRWKQRTDRIRRLIKDSSLEPERLQWRPLSAASQQQLAGVVAETLDKLRELGPWRKRRLKL